MSRPIQAIAVFREGRVRGTVRFTEEPTTTTTTTTTTTHPRIRIDIDVTGLKKNALHGFHVHECGDMSEQCESMCAHFNPYHKTHGCPGKRERHVGDLGNLQTDTQGRAQYHMYDDVIQLRGTKSNILGRGLIIHADADDCGGTDHQLSSTTGNSGKRIACAVIGYARPPPAPAASPTSPTSR